MLTDVQQENSTTVTFSLGSSCQKLSETRPVIVIFTGVSFLVLAQKSCTKTLKATVQTGSYFFTPAHARSIQNTPALQKQYARTYKTTPALYAHSIRGSFLITDKTEYNFLSDKSLISKVNNFYYRKRALFGICEVGAYFLCCWRVFNAAGVFSMLGACAGVFMLGACFQCCQRIFTLGVCAGVFSMLLAYFLCYGRVRAYFLCCGRVRACAGVCGRIFCAGGVFSMLRAYAGVRAFAGVKKKDPFKLTSENQFRVKIRPQHIEKRLSIFTFFGMRALRARML